MPFFVWTPEDDYLVIEFRYEYKRKGQHKQSPKMQIRVLGAPMQEIYNIILEVLEKRCGRR